MKKIVALSVLAVFFIAPMTFAQKGKVKSEEKKEQRLDRMDEELDLSDDQRKKMEAIHAKYKHQEDANKAAMEKLREERKKIKEAKKSEMKTVLTPEQAKKMEDMHQERKEKKHAVRKEVRKDVKRKNVKTQYKKVEE